MVQRLIMLVGVIVGSTAVTADPPPKPPYERLLKGADATTATELQKEADKAVAAGNYTTAIGAAKELLDLRVRLQGKDHWQAVDQDWNVKSLEKVAGLSAEKKEWWRQKPKKMEEAREDERRRNFEKAALFRKEWVNRCEEDLGDSYPETATSYHDWAKNLEASGKYKEAEQLFRKALEIRRKVLGEDHPSTAESNNYLALRLMAQGRYEEAKGLFQRALEIRRKVLGEEHRETAISCHNVATVLNAQARYEEAEWLFKQARNIYRKEYGDNSLGTAQFNYNLADNLNSQGKYTEAEQLLREVLKVRQEALGDDDPATANSYKSLAMSLLGQRKDMDARDNLVLAIRAYESARMWARDGLDQTEFASDTSPYQLLAVVWARLRDPKEAWDAAETAAVRRLLDPTAGNDLTPAEEIRRARLASDRQEIQSRLNELRQKTLSPAEEKERNALPTKRDELRKELSKLTDAANRRRVADLGAVRAALPPDTALVRWVDVVDKSGGVTEHWGCVVRAAGEPAWEPLSRTGRAKVWTADDTDLPGRLRLALVGDRGAAPAPRYEVDRLARDLHAQRLAPLEKHLAGVKHLVVVQAGAMAAIPFEVLTEKFTVSYTPSGTFLAKLKGPPLPAAGGVLLFGDPTYPTLPTRMTPTPPPTGGVLVKHVVPQGLAARAGIRSGDVLLTYAGKNLTSADEFNESVVRQPAGSDVPVEVWREGEEQTTVKYVQPGRLGVILNSRPAPEIAGLEALFGTKATSLTGTHASRARLEELQAGGALGGFRYLHLAAQVKTNNHRVFESALILAGDQKDVTRLPAADLAKWKLNADLVTLSVGETGLGQQGSGDGLLGFAQAFLNAGSRAVCLSLWKVDDTATCLLMDRFYGNLLGKPDGLKKPMGKAAALAEAKRWLRGLSGEEAGRQLARLTQGVEEGPNAKHLEQGTLPFTHPRHWAGFILIGDPN